MFPRLFGYVCALSIVLLCTSGHLHAQERTLWEYLELLSNNSGVTLSTPTEVTRFENAEALCKRLQPSAKRGDINFATNLLGREGWELVAQTSTVRKEGEENLVASRWTFKRKVLLTP